MSASGPPSSSPQPRRGGGSVASGRSRRSVALSGRDAELAVIARVLERRAGGQHRRPGPERRAGHRQVDPAGACSRGRHRLPDPVDPRRGERRRARACRAAAPAHAAARPARPGARGAGGRARRRARLEHRRRPPAPLLVAGATLALLSVAAADGPLLVVVDDAHWLDHESASALLFAVRRMRDDPVVFLLAARAESPAAYELADLPSLSLAGLTAAQVREAWPELVPDVAALLADQTLGNPLVLGDVVPLLSAAQRAGAAPLPVPLPVGARPLGSLAARLVGLSEDAAHLALLHALAGAGEEHAVEAAAVADGVPPRRGPRRRPRRARPRPRGRPDPAGASAAAHGRARALHPRAAQGGPRVARCRVGLARTHAGRCLAPRRGHRRHRRRSGSRARGSR